MAARAPLVHIDWPALTQELRRRHGAHTVLLYGSHARGGATADSDIDLVAIRAAGGEARDLDPWRGHALDVHLYGEAAVGVLSSSRAPALRDARVLCQQQDLGERLLAAVHARLAEPPAALPPAEQAALWAWGDKMRARVAHPDATVAAYHRATLLVESLPAWAQVRGRWFFGAKAALRSLPAEDPAMAAAFAAAAVAGAEVGAFHRLLDAVFDARISRPAACGSAAPVPAQNDAEFLDAFERAALPLGSWHHREHLRAAYLLLGRHPFERALERMRAGIRAMNARLGLPERLDSGYHETLTQLWLRLLHGLRTAVGPEAGFEAFLERHPYLLDRHLGRLYYTRERILTEQAKREFVAPDLAPFPGGPSAAAR